MNVEKIKNYLFNLYLRWRTQKALSKILLFSIVLLIPITFLLVMSHSTTGYVMLYSADQLNSDDLPKIKEILDSLKANYKVSENNLILVPFGEEQQLRMELATHGFPKPKQSKGYELFDSTTWIKGEKELQMLELRALKGQIEKDLAQCKCHLRYTAK
jgi:flagellar biosynthesis/type III secretory pathway M-ring protein FliF/YscJ